MKFLSKEQLLRFDNTGVVTMDVSDVNGDMDDDQQVCFRVRGLRGSERDHMGKVADRGDTETILALRHKLTLRCILKDENSDAPMFTDKEIEEVDFPAVVIEEAWRKIKELSAIRGDEDIQEMSGN